MLSTIAPLNAVLDRVRDQDELARTAAAVVRDAIGRTLQKQDRCVLALTGGSTPAAGYRLLSTFDLPWERIHVVQTDDHIEPQRGTGPAWQVIETSLLDPCGTPRINRHAMPVRAPGDRAAAAEAYGRSVRALLHGARPDVVVLGLGEDGHTASIFPESAAAFAAEPVAVVTGPYRGKLRMTLTLPVLASARCRIMLVSGVAKSAAVARVLAGRHPDVRAASAFLRDGGTLVADEPALRQVVQVGHA